MSESPKKGGVCTWENPRPDLQGIGHHPISILVTTDVGAKTYHCKVCELRIVVPKAPRSL